MLGAATIPGCGPTQKPAPPLAQDQKNPVSSVTQKIPPSDVVTDASHQVDDEEQSAAQEMADAPHPDIFASGDRSIVLGTDEWVTLEDGRQVKVVYSADGKLLTINDTNIFEMWSKTSLGLSLQSQIEVYEVAIIRGKLVIRGKARRVSGDTIMTQAETQDFVGRLAEGQEPGFPVSTPLSTGLIKKHEHAESAE